VSDPERGASGASLSIEAPACRRRILSTSSSAAPVLPVSWQHANSRARVGA
jgi:hypothetical protein